MYSTASNPQALLSSPEAYVLTLDALAQAWPVRCAGVVATAPAFIPSSDDSPSRLEHARAAATRQMANMGTDPQRWPFLGSLLRRVEGSR